MCDEPSYFEYAIDSYFRQASGGRSSAVLCVGTAQQHATSIVRRAASRSGCPIAAVDYADALDSGRCFARTVVQRLEHSRASSEDADRAGLPVCLLIEDLGSIAPFTAEEARSNLAFVARFLAALDADEGGGPVLVVCTAIDKACVHSAVHGLFDEILTIPAPAPARQRRPLAVTAKQATEHFTSASEDCERHIRQILQQWRTFDGDAPGGRLDAQLLAYHRPPSGILLHGAPGSGKTSFARALAARFEPDCAFFAVEMADILHGFVGESERALADVFERAAAAQPSILFFDEIDALASRDGGRIVGKLTTLLMNLMDDLAQQKAKVLVIGATNFREMVNEQLLRPGRLDVSVELAPAPVALREFFVHLVGAGAATPADAPPATMKTFAEVSAYVQSARAAAARRALRSGTENVALQTEDFLLSASIKL